MCKENLPKFSEQICICEKFFNYFHNNNFASYIWQKLPQISGLRKIAKFSPDPRKTDPSNIWWTTSTERSWLNYRFSNLAEFSHSLGELSDLFISLSTLFWFRELLNFFVWIPELGQFCMMSMKMCGNLSWCKCLGQFSKIFIDSFPNFSSKGFKWGGAKKSFNFNIFVDFVSRYVFLFLH